MADPSLRRDPVTGTLWLAYTHVTTHVATDAGAMFLDISTSAHLAKSTDDGRTFTFDHVMRAAAAEVDQGPRGGSGYSGYEVTNLAFNSGTSSSSLSVSHRYHNPLGPAVGQGNPNNFLPDSHHLLVDIQSSPQGLGNDIRQQLTGTASALGWGTDVNLSMLDSTLARCAVWTEPALLIEKNTVYLLAQCLYVNGNQLQRHLGFLAVFSAPAPLTSSSPLVWNYLGKLAGNAEAMELDARAIELTQGDLVLGRDGQMLLIATPNEILTDEKHLGCWVLEVEGLDPPRLRRQGGKLVVRAIVKQSDAGPLGTGACTYEASSTTGLLMVHRTQGSGMAFTVHVTGLHL